MKLNIHLLVVLMLGCILTGCTDRKQEFLLSVSEMEGSQESIDDAAPKTDVSQEDSEETVLKSEYPGETIAEAVQMAESYADMTGTQHTTEIQPTPVAGSGTVNINTADKQTLMTLNGIGKVRAEAILSYREEYGAFQTVDDLLKISGIGKKTLAKIRDRVVTG